MSDSFDVFISYARKDSDSVIPLAEAVRNKGLKVWLDQNEIEDFSSITKAINDGLANSKALLAFYSHTYPLRRACQWELTAAFLAAASRGDPSNRVLVVNPEAGTEHIYPIQFREALFRTLSTPISPEALEGTADSIWRHVDALTGRLGIATATRPTVWFGMKGLGSTRFIGRVPELWAIHSLLHSSAFPMFPQATQADIAQLVGLAGTGKSLTAEEYALRFSRAYPGGVFWLQAFGHDTEKMVFSPEALEVERGRQINGFATAVGLPVQGRTHEEIEQLLARHIEKASLPCLWIVDDLPPGLSAESLRKWSGPHPLVKTLFTSRSRDYGALSGVVAIEVLPEEDALWLLTRRRKPIGLSEEQAARRIVQLLGTHALAIEIAGAWLSATSGLRSFEQFEADLNREDKDILELAGRLSDVLPNGHDKSIAATFLGSIRRLNNEGADILRLSSLLAPSPLSPRFLSRSLALADGLSLETSDERTGLGLAQAESVSLIEREGTAEEYRTVHPLIIRTLRFTDTHAARRSRLREGAVKASIESISQLTSPEALSQVSDIVPHARQLTQESPTSLDVLRLIGFVALYDHWSGYSRTAEAAFQLQVEHYTSILGPTDSKTLAAMHYRSLTLVALGEYAKAQEIQELAIKSLHQSVPPEHPNLLTAEAQLGQILQARGKFREALAIFQRVLDRRRSAGESAQLEVAKSLNDVASVLQLEGDYEAARKHLEEALEIQSNKIGRAHLESLVTINNLGQANRALGNLDEAISLQREVLELRQAKLGKQHPLTLASMNNLAETLGANGDLMGACKIQEDAREVYARTLSEEHPNALALLNNLAETYRGQGRIADALALHRKLFEIQSKKLAPEHPDFLTQKNNLALALKSSDNLTEAQKLLEEVLEARSRTLGRSNPATLVTMNNLGSTLYLLNQVAKARELQEEAYSHQVKAIGPEHEDTLMTMNDLAITLREVGQLDRAKALQEEFLTIRSSQHTVRHESLVVMENELAETLRRLGRYPEARVIRERLVEKTCHLYGEKNEKTSKAALNLVLLLLEIPDRRTARTTIKRWLEWLLKEDLTNLSIEQKEIRSQLRKLIK